MESAKFEYSSLGKALEKQTKKLRTKVKRNWKSWKTIGGI